MKVLEEKRVMKDGKWFWETTHEDGTKTSDELKPYDTGFVDSRSDEQRMLNELTKLVMNGI